MSVAAEVRCATAEIVAGENRALAGSPESGPDAVLAAPEAVATKSAMPSASPVAAVRPAAAVLADVPVPAREPFGAAAAVQLPRP